MIQKFKKALFTKESSILIGILLLSLFLRIYRVDEYLTFLGDEGRDVLVVKHILDGDLTLLGPTASVGGFFLGPIYYYMMAPFLLLFNYNPVGPAVMVALFGAATVFLVYRIAKDFFGVKEGLVSAFLYAISPLVITYSRSSWNPNVVPFFTILMLYVLYKSIINKSWKLLLASGVLFGILLQLHYLATFLAVIVFFYVLLSSLSQAGMSLKSFKELLKRYVLFSFGTLIGWFPFLLFELRHGFQNFQSIFKFVFSSGDTGGNEKYLEIASNVFFRVFGRLLITFPRVEDLEKYNSEILQAWGVGVWMVAAMCIAISAYALWKSYKRKNNVFYQQLLLLLWLFVGVILFGFYKKPIYDYYLGFLYPVPFLLLAGLLYYLFKLGKIVVVLAWLGVIGLSVLSLVYNPFRTPGNHQLAQVRGIAEFILEKTNGAPYNFAVISDGGNSDHAYRYFFEVNNRKPVTIEFEGVDPERKTVTDQLLIVCESLPCEPRGYPLWEVAGFGQAEIVGEWQVSVLKVYKLKHASQTY